jgi:hypothetical protein
MNINEQDHGFERIPAANFQLWARGGDGRSLLFALMSGRSSHQRKKITNDHLQRALLNKLATGGKTWETLSLPGAIELGLTSRAVFSTSHVA